jgi:plasmid replication initiation protein
VVVSFIIICMADSDSSLFDEEELNKLNSPKIPAERKFLLQPNVISRSINDVEATEKKLMALAMSYMPYKIENDNDYTVSFSISEAIKALDLTDGQNQRNILENAVKKISGKQIIINQENGDWFAYTWFDKASWQPSNKMFSLTFNKALGDALMQYKRAYSQIDLASLGRLSSKYSIRYFEIGMSYAGNKGINGNPKGKWYYEYSVDQIKQLFMIDKKQYKRTCDFTRRVVYDPIDLLNEAKVGFTIEPVPITKGKKLLGFRFVCTESEKIPRKNILLNKKDDQEIIYTTLDDEEIEEERSKMDELKNKYPEEYEQILEKVKEENQNNPIGFPEIEAFRRLEELHGES